MSKRRLFFITCLLAVSSLFSVARLWQHGGWLLGVLLAIAAAMLLLRRSWHEFRTFAFCSLAGAAAEMVAIHGGAWTYGAPDGMGIPIWLPVLWGIAGVFVVRVHEIIK